MQEAVTSNLYKEEDSWSGGFESCLEEMSQDLRSCLTKLEEELENIVTGFGSTAVCEQLGLALAVTSAATTVATPAATPAASPASTPAASPVSTPAPTPAATLAPTSAATPAVISTVLLGLKPNPEAVVSKLNAENNSEPETATAAAAAVAAATATAKDKPSDPNDSHQIVRSLLQIIITQAVSCSEEGQVGDVNAGDVIVTPGEPEYDSPPLSVFRSLGQDLQENFRTLVINLQKEVKSKGKRTLEDQDDRVRKKLRTLTDLTDIAKELEVIRALAEIDYDLTKIKDPPESAQQTQIIGSVQVDFFFINL